MLPKSSGQGLIQEKWKESVPWPITAAVQHAGFLSGVACVTCTSRQPEQHLVWNLFRTAYTRFHLLGKWEISKISMNVLFLGFTFFYISNLEKKKCTAT